MGESERSTEAEGVGMLAHEPDDVGDVLLQRNAEEFGAGDEVLALDAARERLVLHPLLHRARLEVKNALARSDERRCGNETAQLIAREQRLLEQTVARHTGDFLRVRENRANRPLGIALRAQNLGAFVRMVAERRPPLVVEIVQQSDDAPLLLVLAELARVTADP